MTSQKRFFDALYRSLRQYAPAGFTLLTVALGITVWRASETVQTESVSVGPPAATLNREKLQSPFPSNQTPQIVVAEKTLLLKKPQKEKYPKAPSQLATVIASPTGLPHFDAKEGLSPALNHSNQSGETSYQESSEAKTFVKNGEVTPVVDGSKCQDVAKTEWNLHRVMGWSPKTLAKARVLTGLSPEDLCLLPLQTRNQLSTAVKEARKADATGMIAYKRSRLLDSSGRVPVDALYKAVGQHKQLLEKQEFTSNRAGISPASWTAMGPTNSYSGRVLALHVDPRNSAVMLVGTSSGGIWRTADAGASWYPINSYSPAFSITALRADPNNPDTIYATTGERDLFAGAGLWRSIDNGLTWSSIESLAPGVTIPNMIPGADIPVGQLFDVAISKASSQIIVVPGELGIFVTKDGGIAWLQVAEEKDRLAIGQTWKSPPASSFFASFDPKDSRKVYVGTSRGTLIIGTDLGTPNEQWKEITIVNTTSQDSHFSFVTAMAWSRDGSRAWITTGEDYGTVYHSTDGGLSFTKLATLGYCWNQCGYNDVLWVDPFNSDRVVVGGVGIHRSVDGGVQWEDIGWGKNQSKGHVDYHAAVVDSKYDGTTNKVVYFGNDGGVFRISDITAPSFDIDNPENGFLWENFGKGIDATQFYAIEANSIAGIVIGGTQDNGNYQYLSGSNWNYIGGGDGGFGGISNDGKTLYISTQNTLIGRIQVEQEIGEDISQAIREVDRGLFITPLTLDPNNNKRMYVGAKSLWVSDDVSTGIPIWRAVTNFLPDPNGWVPTISAISVTPGDPNHVWVGYDNGHIYHTLNALATNPTWILSRTNPSRSYQPVTSIFVSPLAPQSISITLGGWSSSSGANNVFQSHDSGASWTDISGNLPRTVAYSIVEHPTLPNYLYLGTETGIYATTDGITWSASNDGPALVPVYMLKWYDKSTLLAATHGRGVWKATFGTTLGAPRQLVVSPGDRQLTLSFMPPLDDAGSPITEYVVTSNPTGGIDNSAGTATLTRTITGLTNGVPYRFTVRSINSLGESVESTASQPVVPSETDISAEERSTLLNLFESTNGSNWTNSTNWGGPGRTECTWYGISCNEAKNQVMEVSLNNNNLVGSLPALNGMKALRSFNVNDNKLIGNIPIINELKNLQGFGAANNQLSGSIFSFSGLSNLKGLNLSGNKLTGDLSILSELISLSFLNLSYNQFSGSIPHLSTLKQLSDFYVSFNQLTGFMPNLGELKSLKYFSASNNQLSGSIPSLFGLNELILLAVDRNQLTGNLPNVEGLAFLRDLVFEDNQISGSIPNLSGLSSLKRIDASSNQLSGPVPPAPPALFASASNLCNNHLLSSGNLSVDFAWNVAAPNWQSCQTTSNLLPQSIRFSNPGSRSFGDPPFTLSALGGGSGNPVIFSSISPSVCSTSGNTVTLLGGGTCVILANQEGDSKYAAASQVEQIFVVTDHLPQAFTQTIIFPNPGPKMLGFPPFELVATGGASVNPVTFSTFVSDVCTVEGSKVTLIATGTCTISADQSGNSSYVAAAQVVQSFLIAKANQAIGTIRFDPKSLSMGGTSTASVTASSGLAVAFSSTTPTICTVSGSTVTGVAAGTCTITASQSGNSTFAAATPVSQNLAVGLTSQTIGTISFNPTSLSVGGSSTASATASSGLAVAFSSTTPTICTVSGPTVTGVSAGTCTIAADQAGDASYSAAPQVSANITVTSANPTRLLNIATRGKVETVDNVMIAGFIIQGSSPKKVLIRARGPSLAAAPFNVPGTLADPFLTLYSGATPIDSNDDFAQHANAAQIPTDWIPGNAKEAAIVTTLNPGAYTAIVNGVGSTSGIGIVEVFEMDRPETPLINIATRGPVYTGDNVMIAGLIIQGDAPKTVLITARGPSMAGPPHNVPGTLANATLTLYSGQTVIASNDNWPEAANAAQIQTAIGAPTNALESAILVTLQPGAYTAIVSGAGGGTGLAIVEVFAQ